MSNRNIQGAAFRKILQPINRCRHFSLKYTQHGPENGGGRDGTMFQIVLESIREEEMDANGALD